MKELGELVARQRIKQGIEYQKDLAKAVGKDPSWLSRLEGGSAKETPEPEVMHRLAAILNVSEVDLLRAAGYFIPDLTPEDMVCIPRDSVAAQVVSELAEMSEKNQRMWASLLEVGVDYQE